MNGRSSVSQGSIRFIRKTGENNHSSMYLRAVSGSLGTQQRTTIPLCISGQYQVHWEHRREQPFLYVSQGSLSFIRKTGENNHSSMYLRAVSESLRRQERTTIPLCISGQYQSHYEDRREQPFLYVSQGSIRVITKTGENNHSSMYLRAVSESLRRQERTTIPLCISGQYQSHYEDRREQPFLYVSQGSIRVITKTGENNHSSMLASPELSPRDSEVCNQAA